MAKDTRGGPSLLMDASDIRVGLSWMEVGAKETLEVCVWVDVPKVEFVRVETVVSTDALASDFLKMLSGIAVGSFGVVTGLDGGVTNDSSSSSSSIFSLFPRLGRRVCGCAAHSSFPHW